MNSLIPPPEPMRLLPRSSVLGAIIEPCLALLPGSIGLALPVHGAAIGLDVQVVNVIALAIGVVLVAVVHLRSGVPSTCRVEEQI